jgi:hypothetical protein
MQVQNDGRFKTTYSYTSDYSYTTFSNINNSIYAIKGEYIGITTSSVSTLSPGSMIIPSDISVSTFSYPSYTMTNTVSSGGHTSTTTTTVNSATFVITNEAVTVPAGTFNAIKFTNIYNNTTVEYWYAYGIGLVKGKVFVASTNTTSITELTSYLVK